jgi:hypothetical protein
MSAADGNIRGMTAEETEAYRPAPSVEPLWQVKVDGEWLTVDTVIQTEGYIYLYFVDHRPAAAARTDLVRSRIPQQAR